MVGFQISDEGPQGEPDDKNFNKWENSGAQKTFKSPDVWGSSIENTLLVYFLDISQELKIYIVEVFH